MLVRGSSATNMFSNSKMSELNPNNPLGGGGRGWPNWEFFPISFHRYFLTPSEGTHSNYVSSGSKGLLGVTTITCLG